MKKLFPTLLAAAVVILALPYLSMGVSVFMAKWAYDWGLPVPVLKLILLAIAILILIALFNLIKKVVVITIIAALVLIGLNALGIYNMKTDPKDIIAQVSAATSEQSDTLIAATSDLWYQAKAYTAAVEPVETLKNLATERNSFWYLSHKNEQLDLSQSIFDGYKVTEIKEAGEFKAYHFVQRS